MAWLRVPPVSNAIMQEKQSNSNYFFIYPQYFYKK